MVVSAGADEDSNDDQVSPRDHKHSTQGQVLACCPQADRPPSAETVARRRAAVSGVSGVSWISGVSKVNGVSGASKISWVSKVRMVSKVSGVSNVSRFIGVNEVRGVSKVSGVSKVIGVSKVSKVNGISKVSKVNGISKISKVNGVSKVSEINGVSRVSRVSRIGAVRTRRPGVALQEPHAQQDDHGVTRQEGQGKHEGEPHKKRRTPVSPEAPDEEVCGQREVEHARAQVGDCVVKEHHVLSGRRD
ncbi:M protein, serotype 2.1 [Elysia marginata]|uniref:M protein, serotype 2.1 n=1 Tax=Elysia marginata TaxID=1093978 RepID=A0AAV4FQT7_9GAST|nr:M protein, serotype 2.1 [Elysia marginata]